MSPSNKLCLALDFPDKNSATEWVKLTCHHVGVFKIGLELFCAEGLSIVSAVREAGAAHILWSWVARQPYQRGPWRLSRRLSFLRHHRKRGSSRGLGSASACSETELFSKSRVGGVNEKLLQRA